jgi:dipeptidyl aminopeptidase/acylaminoacyl peptidase
MSATARFCLAGIFLIAWAPAAPAQENVFTPQHVARLRVVTAAVISPDGTQVAYVLSVPRQLPREKDGPAWAELHVVDAKGTVTPYVAGPVNVEAVAWTADGKGLSFLTKREKDAHKDLYLIPLRGGEARKVLEHGADIQAYSWSPSGKEVAYLAAEPESKAKKARKDQGFTQEIYEEDFTPTRVWVATLGDTKPPRMLKLEGSASEVHWNPKNDWLAVALAPTPLVDDSLMFRKLHMVHARTGEAFNLKNPGKMGQFAWSPDGKRLALISGVDKHDPKEGRLWVTTLQDKTWTDALPKFQGHVEAIAWGLDETWPYYLASRGTQVALGTDWLLPPSVPVAATDKRSKSIFGGSSALILEKLTASTDGKALAFVGHNPEIPPEVYLLMKDVPPGATAPRRLTDSNPWLRDMRLAHQEVVAYKARDGLDLEGILVRPLDEKKGQRYPLVVTVHGGPEAHVCNGWVTLYHSLGQVGAARGLAVFYPNYRGSTGRGVAFSMMGQREAAGKEFDDLVDGVDHLVKMGLVDDKKVGITGGSYGGYATAWGSTYYSHRFAAGVMFVGISDCVSKVGTTDIPWEMNLVHHRKWLWEDWDYFKRSSPIYHTDKAKTPLLILHGKADPRVHPSQSLELHRHLKLRGQAPVRLVLYPGEGHGNRRAASRLDYNLRMLQWMEHYLKGPGGAPPPFEIDYALEPSTKGAGTGWRRPPLRLSGEQSPFSDVEMLHRLGRGCPCCIGW